MNTTLYTLFTPPEGCFGDFGLFSGFTATPAVLHEIRRSFTGDMSRPVLAAFIHPTVNPVSNVPQLAWMWMKPDKRGYNLLHAKVALLGFRKRDEEGYVIRLAVITGNWTQDPLTNSIDLFWSIDVDVSNPKPQDIADIRAAWAMFDWLRERADCSLIEREYDGYLPDFRLRAAIVDLPASGEQPRFVDSRTKALFPQVVERLVARWPATSLVLGSGYFDAKVKSDGGLIDRLWQRLVSERSLKEDAGGDVFLNPQSCQGLARVATELKEKGWELRRPSSLLHDGPDARLHAKFVMIACGGYEKITSGRIYLGSGNLTRNGFEKAADEGGNLEAGVVIDVPSGLSWYDREGIAEFLPIHDWEAADPTDLATGEEFTHPEAPESTPPVSWLFWQDGQLSAPNDTRVKVIGKNGDPVETPCEWPEPAPTFVTLAEAGWRLPVIADGVLVTPRPRDLTVEDVLAGLLSFPEPSESDYPDDGPEGSQASFEGTIAPATQQARYPIRRMMQLIVGLGDSQVDIDALDWPRWCRELQQKLCAITKQEAPMIEFFRDAKANPLPVLVDPRMLPDGADVKALNDALDVITKAWGLNEYPSLWDEEEG